MVSLPKTDGNKTRDGWTSTGAHSMYSVNANERALGYQLQCKDCKKDETPGENKYCLATTNPKFWARWLQWKIPSMSSIFWRITVLHTDWQLLGEIPYFFKKSAVMQELFNLITEFRPSSTSAGVAECLKCE
jgi:hypothetical protein